MKGRMSLIYFRRNLGKSYYRSSRKNHSDKWGDRGGKNLKWSGLKVAAKMILLNFALKMKVISS